MAKVPFGNRKANVLANLAGPDRLDLIAEGMPIILDSADGFWASAAALGGNREARVLEGFAEEEAAKVLILCDLVRCPASLAPRKAGQVVTNFYSHLARMIYGDAQAWRPASLEQLRGYVDSARRGHFLEGYAGEFILPNWHRYARESAMYADIEVHESGIPTWNRPRQYTGLWSGDEPPILRLAHALSSSGALTRRGLEVMGETWSHTAVTDEAGFNQNRFTVGAFTERLVATGLASAATLDQLGILRHHWQVPMYDLDFAELAVPIEDLKAEREALMRAEFGDPPEAY
jgi:hypothetical protein